MIYKVKFKKPLAKPDEDDMFEFYADSYQQIAQIINTKFFSGFYIIKAGTIKCSYKKNSTKNHLLSYIPTFQLEKMDHTNFESKKKYHAFRKTLI